MSNDQLDIIKGSFFQSSFRDGVFIYELMPNVMVNEEMYEEFHGSLKHIYDSIGGQFPILIKIIGFIGMDQASRRLAKLRREEHLAYVSACVTSSHMISGIMKLIYNVVGSKSIPRDFFSQEDKAFDWLRKKQKELGKKIIIEKDVFERILSKQKLKTVRDRPL